MDKQGPAPHVLAFYWCVLLIDVTSVRLGRALDRAFSRKRRRESDHAGERVPIFIRKSS
mgnify:CR=1